MYAPVRLERTAGKAVVQFATLGNVEYAMKFFVSRSAFQKEADLYANPEDPLYKFLPPMHHIIDNADGALVDAEGNPLPPCIVIERGESLDSWARGGKFKRETDACMQVRTAATACACTSIQLF